MPHALRLLARAGRQWNENNDLRWGAGLAYYALFSIAPVLILAIDMAAVVFGPEAARGEVQTWLKRFIDTGAADAIGAVMQSASRREESIWGRALSFAVLVVGSVGVFLHIRAALCAIWRLPPPKLTGVMAFAFDYVLALLMVLLVGVLLVVSLVAGMILPVLHAFVQERLPYYETLWQIVELGLSAAFLTLLFALVYRVLSGRRIAWRQVWFGAVIAAVLFTLGKTLLGYYLVYTGTASAYGAAGSLVVFLMWVYYSSQVLFFGAELIQARRTTLDEAPTMVF